MNPKDFSQYVGRYKQGDDSVVYVVERNGTLIFRSILWQSAQILCQVNQDEFVVMHFENRTNQMEASRC